MTATPAYRDASTRCPHCRGTVALVWFAAPDTVIHECRDCRATWTIADLMSGWSVRVIKHDAIPF